MKSKIAELQRAVSSTFHTHGILFFALINAYLPSQISNPHYYPEQDSILCDAVVGPSTSLADDGDIGETALSMPPSPSTPLSPGMRAPSHVHGSASGPSYVYPEFGDHSSALDPSHTIVIS